MAAARTGGPLSVRPSRRGGVPGQPAGYLFVRVGSAGLERAAGVRRAYRKDLATDLPPRMVIWRCTRGNLLSPLAQT